MVIRSPELEVKLVVDRDPRKISSWIKIVLLHEDLSLIHYQHERLCYLLIEQNLIYFGFRESNLYILSKLKVVKAVYQSVSALY